MRRITLLSVGFLFIASVANAGPNFYPPARDTTLAVAVATDSSVHLTFLDSGDDCWNGTAHTCEVRYSTSAITESNYDGATVGYTGSPAGAGGTPDSCTVSGLDCGVSYYFVVTFSDGTYRSPVGTLASVVTRTNLERVTDLAVSRTGRNTMILAFTDPGNSCPGGTVEAFEIRRSSSEINESNYDNATVCTTGTPAGPKGTVECIELSGLSCLTPYYFAITFTDAAGYRSAVSNCAHAHTLSCGSQVQVVCL